MALSSCLSEASESTHANSQTFHMFSLFHYSGQLMFKVGVLYSEISSRLPDLPHICFVNEIIRNSFKPRILLLLEVAVKTVYQIYKEN